MVHALVLLAALGGCATSPQSIAEVHLEEGFVLDTHHRVAVVVAPDAFEPESVRLAVRRVDGEPLFAGTAALAMQRDLRVKVPDGTRALVVEARFVDGRAATRTVDLADGRFTVALGSFR